MLYFTTWSFTSRHLHPAKRSAAPPVVLARTCWPWQDPFQPLAEQELAWQRIQDLDLQSAFVPTTRTVFEVVVTLGTDVVVLQILLSVEDNRLGLDFAIFNITFVTA